MCTVSTDYTRVNVYMHRAYRLYTVSTDYTYTCIRIRIHVVYMCTRIRLVYVYACTLIHVYARIRTYLVSADIRQQFRNQYKQCVCQEQKEREREREN